MKKRYLLYLIITFIFTFISRNSLSAELPSLLEITIPDYEIIKLGELDYIEILGGEILLVEEGRPRVPYYIQSIDYPKGYRVQDIVLIERSGLKKSTGLKLPVVITDPRPKIKVEMKKGWYPKEEYNWRVWENPDGSTTLVIAVYPFYYDPETTHVKFYRNYKFDINYIISTVDITDLALDKDTYRPEDSIVIDMWLNSFGEAQDVVVSIVIRRYGSDEMVDGLPLRSLKNLVGDASLTAKWNSENTEPGHYYVEAILSDATGNTLGKRTAGFGIQLAETPEKPTETSTIYFIIFGATIIAIALIASLIVKRRSTHQK